MTCGVQYKMYSFLGVGPSPKSMKKVGSGKHMGFRVGET